MWAIYRLAPGQLLEKARVLLDPIVALSMQLDIFLPSNPQELLQQRCIPAIRIELEHCQYDVPSNRYEPHTGTD
ncbi:hypothetical protein K443DRAFT_674731 [Laccaria amethystina LaAM-08-1]|uniref:Uncharacterized protein n=1 Tax=Laccaria amethystina LaAM-08-1 TaxID=1095629 RepID=A0A0C9XLG8_9AGAR|nr:hypothetical protein K443DRAFT_674731 [Laccaria amethystina LaAM-08-1]